MKRRLLPALLASAALALPAGAQDGAGFAFSRGDRVIAGDPQLRVRVAGVDRALARGDLRVQVDGLEVRPRLDVRVVPGASGAKTQVHSHLNYPAFVTRGELRVLDLAARGGAQTLAIVPIAPNGSASFVVPLGRDVAVVHRVYDAQGRFDETRPRRLALAGTGAVQELGTDSTARRRIPVRGGAVTVSGGGLSPQARVETLGEVLRPDAAGRFAVQRILPTGEATVGVRVSGPGQTPLAVDRPVVIPQVDWFRIGLVDLTFGRRLQSSQPGVDDTYARGRVAAYAKGHTAGGWTLTGSLDTGEAPLDNLFDDLARKDPQGLLLQLAREDSYLTYGDDSQIEDGAPTRGKLFLKAEKDGNVLMWGNAKSTVSGGRYLRNERLLYGLHGQWRSADQTDQGQARQSLSFYAAQPDALPGRDVFQGTGGSIYFLQRHNITPASETLTIERRDRVTDRVIGQQVLVAGRDYDLNPLQGVVVLAAPLSGSASQGVVLSDPAGDTDVRLVVQYEYEPAVGDVDGLSYGARAEAWLNEDWRLGATGLVEQTDLADQTARALDLRWQPSERSFIELDVAQSDGPGFGSSLSSDGGLIVTTVPGQGGSGRAFALRGQLAPEDMGGPEGLWSWYYERREAGFSTLDYQAAADEELWGLSLELAPSDALRWRLSYDDRHDSTGLAVSQATAEVDLTLTHALGLSLGIEHIDRHTPGTPDETGQRTDIAARLDVTHSPALSWYVFGQATLDRSGGLPGNSRAGLGLDAALGQDWRLAAEVSDGDLGLAGRAQLTHQTEQGDTTYVGYRLDPGRDLAGITLDGRDQGQVVAGARRRVNDQVTVFAENTYDLFGRHQSLTSAYGVDYQPTNRLRYSAGFDLGRVRDPAGDFDRNALSFGLRYDRGDLTLGAKLEYRQDRGVLQASGRDSDMVLVTGDLRWQIDDAQRLMLGVNYAGIDSDSSTVLSGDYLKAQLGYALRPTLSDRVNLLFRYTYLSDMVGQRVDGSDTPGPRQESHVLSVDGLVDLNRHWTMGGKLGLRLSDSAPDQATPLQQNDAWLGILNARYHLTHKWDVLLEGRRLVADQAGFAETSVLGAVSRQMGRNFSFGVGYNFGSFSDDLTDLTLDDEGLFLNLSAKF